MRVFLFNKGKTPGRLPSTSGALKLHIRRAHYQTTIWLNVTVPSQEHIDAGTFAGLRNQLKPKLLLFEPIPKVCTQLLQCSCKCVQQDGANVDLILVILISSVLGLWFYHRWQST